MIALNALTRLTAVPCQIRDIAETEQLPLESGNTFFHSPLGIVSRVVLTGLLISWDGEVGMLDDGTGQIIFRCPEQHPRSILDSLNIGSILFLTARLRNLGKETYLSVETAHALTDPYWLTYRKFEIALFRMNAPTEVSSPTPPPSPAQGNTTQTQEDASQSLQKKHPQDILLDTIRLLDTGDGADIELVMKHMKADDDEQIQKFIKQGDIYEHKPGKLKILE